MQISEGRASHSDFISPSLIFSSLKPQHKPTKILHGRRHPKAHYRKVIAPGRREEFAMGDCNTFPAIDLTSVVKQYIPQVHDPNDVPYVGQAFDSSKEALAFYKNYARIGGFNVRKESNKKSEDGKGYRWFQFTCSREGQTCLKYQEKGKHKKQRTGERKRGHTRCGCQARLTVTKHKNGNVWEVSIFKVEHNHPLTSPGKVHFMKINWNVTAAQKNLLSQFSQANIPTCQQIRLMGIECGGPSSIGCTERDIRNYEREMREAFLGHDAETFTRLLVREKEADEFFYYSLTKKDGVFERCFWADSTSRSAYDYFGDVVVFDTTFNTNRYGLYFAPIVGVNNHMQTVLFGAGFISDQTTNSFIWLFSQFLEAILGGVIPKVIITDQDQAITGAIGEVFPPSVHHLCLWHITNKFSEKLGSVVYGDYKNDLHNVVYRTETPKEFDRKWGELMSTTPLGGNDWLRSMYGIRKLWVPAFVKDYFAAGMSSSQRVEAHNSFLKSYVLRKNSLADFFARFRLALVHQRDQEAKADYVDKSEVPVSVTSHCLEKQLISIYTKAVFLLFQEELKQGLLYDYSKISSSVDAKMYEVKRVDVLTDKSRLVTWFNATNLMSCSCKLFEFDGYLCRHILCLMYRKGVRVLPDHYILARWTKKARQVPIFKPSPQSIARQSSISARVLMSREFMDVANDVSMSPNVVAYVMKEVREQGKRAREMLVAEGHPTTNTVSTTMIIDDGLSIQDPSVHSKGPGKRLMSSKEKGMIQSSRKCSRCRKPGHTTPKCPEFPPRTALVDEDYHPEMSFTTGNNGDLPVDGMFVSQGADNYSVYQTNDFLDSY